MSPYGHSYNNVTSLMFNFYLIYFQQIHNKISRTLLSGIFFGDARIMFRSRCIDDSIASKSQHRSFPNPHYRQHYSSSPFGHIRWHIFRKSIRSSCCMNFRHSNPSLSRFCRESGKSVHASRGMSATIDNRGHNHTLCIFRHTETPFRHNRYCCRHIGIPVLHKF